MDLERQTVAYSNGITIPPCILFELSSMLMFRLINPRYIIVREFLIISIVDILQTCADFVVNFERFRNPEVGLSALYAGLGSHDISRNYKRLRIDKESRCQESFLYSKHGRVR